MLTKNPTAYIECEQCHGTRLIVNRGVASRCPCAEEDDAAQERRSRMQLEPAWKEKFRETTDDGNGHIWTNLGPAKES
jgi:hypothetical protein